MERSFSQLLLATTDEERFKLVSKLPCDNLEQLAADLCEACLASWATDPSRARNASQCLQLISDKSRSDTIAALASWSSGVAAMINGELRHAIEKLADARHRFTSLGDLQRAASTQIAVLYPLAVLGRYDEAIEFGTWARDVLLQFDDLSGAGRVEHNLGNIYQNSGRYAEAESTLKSALRRFSPKDQPKIVAQITNSIAFVLSYRYKFGEAEQLYLDALQLADDNDLAVTKAEIAANIGYFSLFQGRYDRALEFLNRARIEYEELQMPHRRAIAELEIADAYFELNLLQEAAAIYERVIATLEEAGAKIDQARALTNLAKVNFVQAETKLAYERIALAQALFSSIGNPVGEANAAIAEARFLLNDKDPERALAKLDAAKQVVTRADVQGIALTANLIRAEAYVGLGRKQDALRLLQESLASSQRDALRHLEIGCFVLLGSVYCELGDLNAAEENFVAAIDRTENVRAPLPSEEFRSAFFSDKLRPYTKMMSLCLNDGSRIAEAFEFAERRRARTFAESTARLNSLDSRQSLAETTDPQIAELRMQLNWIYGQINVPQSREGGDSRELVAEWQNKARELEITISELDRQRVIQKPSTVEANSFDPVLERLRERLDDDSSFVEFVVDGTLISAFVVDRGEISVFRHICTQHDVGNLLETFYFQLDSLCFNPSQLGEHSFDLLSRSRQILGRLYDLLIRPLTSSIGRRRLFISPQGNLFRVPFHALYDRFEYIHSYREVSYTPSAAVLISVLERDPKSTLGSLFVATNDPTLPNANLEIEEIASFTNGDKLFDSELSVETLVARTAGKQILHIASHARFRTDNPLYSAIKLGNEWLAARDIVNIDLDPQLVVLSGCETGMSDGSTGDELVGLARSFIAAGASAVVVSLWSVDDETTRKLMRTFYEQLMSGSTVALALSIAQQQLRNQHPHPFYWSPFIVIGDPHVRFAGSQLVSPRSKSSGAGTGAVASP